MERLVVAVRCATFVGMERIKWVDRDFSFGLDPRLMAPVLERLRDMPGRLGGLVAAASDDRLRSSPSGKWNAKQHIGHLVDLETGLHVPRVDDFASGAGVLRPWDGTNRMTDEAGHEQRPITDLLAAMRSIRRLFVERLEALPDGVHKRQSLHPRLQVMMRPVDMAFFVAEHDDHHLATIRELIGQS